MDIKGIILDLDGTVYRGAEEIEGAADFVNSLPDLGIKYIFVTNRSNRYSSVVCEHLAEYGIHCTEENVLNTAEATTQFLGSGCSAYVIGEEPLIKTLEAGGITMNDENPDYVIVSFDRFFTYEKIKTATWLISRGAKFIATNPDPRLHIEGGIVPGTGAVVAAVEMASGQKPVYVGKPEKLIFEMALECMGVSAEESLSLGDNLQTDILAGINAGMKTALILTGASTRADIERLGIKPTIVVESFAELNNFI
ncbi:MAG: TIGR01457 family HAD-type hydrolase [Kiritimatiellae bacterium]|jgi:4-nitrophenyl phosphatase|nr:TIGR01457 family HAD-type hydrolase [Kiritimatiellia bacterium]